MVHGAVYRCLRRCQRRQTWVSCRKHAPHTPWSIVWGATRCDAVRSDAVGSDASHTRLSAPPRHFPSAPSPSSRHPPRAYTPSGLQPTGVGKLPSCGKLPSGLQPTGVGKLPSCGELPSGLQPTGACLTPPRRLPGCLGSLQGSCVPRAAPRPPRRPDRRRPEHHRTPRHARLASQPPPAPRCSREILGDRAPVARARLGRASWRALGTSWCPARPRPHRPSHAHVPPPCPPPTCPPPTCPPPSSNLARVLDRRGRRRQVEWLRRRHRIALADRRPPAG